MKEESLFSLANENENTPLADRVRPQNLSEFVGQDDLIGPGKILREGAFINLMGATWDGEDDFSRNYCPTN